LPDGGGDGGVGVDAGDLGQHCDAHLARGRLEPRSPPRITRIAHRHRDEAEPEIADRARQRALHMGQLRGD
jgi:hypothetical protein